MYRITNREFHSSDYGNEKYLKNWPMLYILENGKEAYIGESTNVYERMNQHKANEEKVGFDTAHFIYSDEFNQSVTFDYESKLIQLFAADEKYTITNKNKGIADKNYYNKAYYDEQFRTLWDRLRKGKLAQSTIDELVNSDLFKYSPYKALNEDQREAVEDIFNSLLLEQHQPIIVNGMPGSGKTIVAIFLFKYIKDYTDVDGNQPFKDKKIALVIPQTSLRKTLKDLFKHIYGLKAADVVGPSDIAKEKYDIALVDEAHRLHQRKNIQNYKPHDSNNRKLGLPHDATELDWIYAQVECPILFFDSDQVVGPSSISREILKQKTQERFGNRMITYYNLMTQMRVKGGNDYIAYIKQLLDGNVLQKKTFENYEFKLVDKFDEFERLLVKKEDEKGLARMVAGYAWPWISKKDKSLKDIKIENAERMWNNRTEGWVHCPTALEEVGCIHSIQGFDLNYAFVILGNDIKYDLQENKIAIDASQYFDRNGKATATGEELLQYIKNIYYVLLTRGIEGTYLYVCNPELKSYLREYVELYNEN